VTQYPWPNHFVVKNPVDSIPYFLIVMVMFRSVILFFRVPNNFTMGIKKLKLSHYMLWCRLEGEEVQFLFILDLGNRWGWVVSALAPRKGPPVPIVQESGWAPEPVWTQRLKEKSFQFCRDRTLNHRVIQCVARHYTDWATLASYNTYIMINFLLIYRQTNVSSAFCFLHNTVG
jgi:hypothetical protein